ncbi:hypothetical protein [Microvirga terrestris]|uniref:Translation initiation factor IF-2 n=1 Tax=Microvirga terrestris TaxID=2791024 RepID=A0ABS0HUK8_9HYPH|nr:hypothetical protein [Microvirga terrestris]MBF9197163.1 hypothetical protein [Microvirga terrestris]
MTASLIGVLSAAAPVFAQTARPWVDPPSDSGAAAPSPAPAAQATQPATPTPQASSASAPSEPTKEKAVATTQSPPEASPGKDEAANQTKQKTAVERKVRRSAQQANSATRSQSRDERATRRREPSQEVSQARAPRNGIERRARVTRYGSAQEGVNAGLEVMRLRTIQLPDGRRIEILTRPNQDIAGGLPDGY